MEVFTVKSSNQVNNVTTRVAAGKAIPQVLSETDHKGVWIITTVNGTWANKPVSLVFEGIQQSFVIEDRGDVNCFFERVEI